MNKNIDFINLRLHSAFSIQHSTLKIEDMVELASQDGQPCVSMTDCETMFGALRFYSAARAGGLKPIIGVDILCSHTELPPIRLLLLAQNFQGYLALVKTISIKKNSSNNSTPSIAFADLPKDNIFCLTGTSNSLGRIISNEPDVGKHWLVHLKKQFHTNLYLEIQRPGKNDDDEIVNAINCAAKLHNIPIVATHPTFFPYKKDFFSHEVRVCDKLGHIIHDRNRPREYTPHQHFLSQKLALELFADFPDALQNSVEIAKRINISIPIGNSVLPNFSTQSGRPLKDELESIAQEGLQKILKIKSQKKQVPANILAEYEERLSMELKVIHSMGFDGYFMIVQDFIAWAKNNNIPVGPGRGSGAGSLVAYTLGITDLDPIDFSLLFERFLNPERVSMPDFDIDFCKEKREKVIAYVTEKYGPLSVSGISNINTLQARAAIKAAGRALGLRMPFVDSVSKLVPAMPGKDVSITSAINDDPVFANRVATEPEVARLIDAAKSLEGLPTAIGQHAAGIVISPTLISDYSPLYQPEGKAQAVTQYDKDDIEKAGLVKFDFLGLKTLTEIQLAVDFVKRTPQQENFAIENIPLDDTSVFDLFQQGDTHCIFQFESPGMKRLLIDAKPTAFGDLVALNALYRPGPMDLIPEYIKRKSGFQSVSYLDDRLEPILGETSGIMVYQEQVMQIAQVIGGYSLGGADLLRRAMGKKKAEEMAKHRKIFIDGAVLKNVTPETAGILYDLMEKFAGYGFNKSHAAAYTLLAYQTAYLKKHFPACFYASWLSIESKEDTAVIPSIIKDGINHGIQIHPPCINLSSNSFSIINESSLRYGLTGLKGIGLDFVENMLKERGTGGEFSSLTNFCQRLKGLVNKKYLEILTKSGAFDCFNQERSSILSHLPDLLKHAKDSVKYSAKHKEWLETTQSGKKKKEPVKPTLIGLPPLAPLPHLEKLRYERDAFGFFFSGHPYTHYASLLDNIKACEPLSKIATLASDWDQHLIAGIINDVRIIDTKSGKFLIATIGDGTSEVEVKAFSTVANRIMNWFKKDTFALLAINIREDRLRGGASLQISDAKNFEDAEILLTEAIHINCVISELPDIQNISMQQPGNMPIYAWHKNGQTIIRSRHPYAFAAKSMEVFQLFKSKFGQRCKPVFLQGKPSTLRG